MSTGATCASKQPWHQHPDIVARVFMCKMHELSHDLVRNEIFGTVKAYVYRIEWQARGLPHSHVLFILKDGTTLSWLVQCKHPMEI